MGNLFSRKCDKDSLFQDHNVMENQENVDESDGANCTGGFEEEELQFETKKILESIFDQRKSRAKKRKIEEKNEMHVLQEAAKLLKELEERYQKKIRDFEKEKEEMAEFNKIQNQVIVLNVGGTSFTTSLQTLQAEPDSKLGRMFSGRHVLKTHKDGKFFIDRDGTHFGFILNYLRGQITSKEQLPDDHNTLSHLSSEAQYYQLKGLLNIIEPIKNEQNTILEPNQERDHHLGLSFLGNDLSFK